MSFSHVLDRIYRLNRRTIKQELLESEDLVEQHFLHLVEEVGEMAKALNGRNDESIHMESIDVLICSLALVVLLYDIHIPAILNDLNKKLDKWENNLEEQL